MSQSADFSKNTKLSKLKIPPGTQISDNQSSSSKVVEEDFVKDETVKIAVKLPINEDKREWLALHTVDYYNQCNMLYGVVSQRCTRETCPKMNAGPRYEYLWADGKTYKAPTSLSAAEYIEQLMIWTHQQIEDRSIFPVEPGANFPKTFETIVSNIFKRLFRVYAHIYHCHFAEIIAMKLEPYLNTCFKHFAYFVKEFDLINDNDLAPLNELIRTFLEESGLSE